jgi:tRNA pseudouridine38-40 synthase
MPRYALTLEFDGGPFMGLQRQSHGPSVQQSVEEAAQSVVGHAVTLHAAGRTDTGVHALGMRAHIDVERPFDPFRLSEALNARLKPDPIAVLDCRLCPTTGTRASRAWAAPMNTASPTAARR